MNLEEIRQRWVNRSAGKAALQQRLWDGMAKDYDARQLPDFETDPFLQNIAGRFPLDSNMKSLDIGCGAGLYTLALAKRAGDCTGVDISPQMIAFAQKRAAGLGRQNTHFYVMDWACANLDALGFYRAFDLVFAHMTPAIADYDTFERMNACSRRWCILEKHTRRTDRILSEACHAAGLGEDSGSFDDGLIYAFSYLWAKGYRPEIQYRQSVSHIRRTQEEMADWCLGRARLRRELGPQEEEAIRAVVASHTVNGIAEETLSSTIVTLSWEV